MVVTKMEKAEKSKEKNVYAGTGISKDDDPYKAGKEAVEMALQGLQGKKPTFGLVFCSGGKYGKDSKSIKKLVSGAHELLNGVPWIGCTTCGEILNDALVTHSCIAMMISSDYFQVGIGIGKNVHKDAISAGKEAATNSLKNIKLDRVVNPYLKYTAQKNKKANELLNMYNYSFILLSPGHTVDVTGMEDVVLEGVLQVLGKQNPIIGGTSGDDFRLLTSYQFANGDVFEDAVIMTAISMGLKCGFGFDHGYVPTGKTAVVTKANGYIVDELDGQGALGRYAEILGIKPEELWDTKSKFFSGASALAKLSSKYWSGAVDPKMIPFLSTVTINPFGVVDIHGNIAIRIGKKVHGSAIEFTQRVPQNVLLTALNVNSQKIIEAEVNAMKQAVEESGSDPSIILIFDCELRKIYAGEKEIEKAIKNLKNKYPRSIIFGFNTMGEFVFNRSSEPMASSASVSVGAISNRLVAD